VSTERAERPVSKVIPKPDDLNLELFTTIVQTGQMCLQQCASCSSYSHPPRFYCGNCFSGEYAFVPVSGVGTVYSYTLSRVTAEAAWKDELPYLTVVVELDEGPRVVGAAVTEDPESVTIGQRVTVVPEPRTEEFAFLTVAFDETGATP
jgi:uncharacterized OB-fold protein